MKLCQVLKRHTSVYTRLVLALVQVTLVLLMHALNCTFGDVICAFILRMQADLLENGYPHFSHTCWVLLCLLGNFNSQTACNKNTLPLSARCRQSLNFILLEYVLYSIHACNSRWKPPYSAIKIPVMPFRENCYDSYWSSTKAIFRWTVGRGQSLPWSQEFCNCLLKKKRYMTSKMSLDHVATLLLRVLIQ